MKNLQGSLQTLLALVALMLPPASFAQNTEDQEWQETGITLDWIRRSGINSKDCSVSATLFTACVEAIQKGLEQKAPLMVLTPEAAIQNDPLFQATTIKFGPLVLGKIKSTSLVNMTASDLHKNLRSFYTNRNNTLKALVDSNLQAVQNTPWTEILEYVRRNIIAEDTDTEGRVAGKMMNGFLQVVYDPHSYLVPAASFQRRNGSEEILGIGVALTTHPDGLLIENPLDGGPAIAAGVRSKDLITHIDNKRLKDLSITDQIKLMGGAEGSTINLTLLRNNQTITLTLKRTRIIQANVSSKLLRDSLKPVGYIKLNSFINKRACEEVKKAVEDLEQRGAEAFVLDLRNNGGGLLDQGVCISGVFLARGTKVVEQRPVGPNADDEQPEIHRTTDDQASSLPLVVLVNASSASASEIVAGALQDHQRAWIVGVTTFGKGTVQMIGPTTALPDRKMYFAHTVARFHQPTGRTNQIVGIIPDIEVFALPHPTAEDKVFSREGDLYQNSLPALGKPWSQPRPAEQQRLAQCVTSEGHAIQLWNARQNDQVQPDYQLLVAQDAAACSEQ